MGFFSWLTSDTQESICNIYSGRPVKTVYLLQPNGQPPIIEENYRGYGYFGEVDAYVWIAKNNLSHNIAKNLSQEELNYLGIGLELGEYLEDPKNGKKFVIFDDYSKLIDDCEFLDINYNMTPPGYDESVNNLKISGKLIAKAFKCKYPLKFSYDPNAVYEDLPAAKNCPSQGFFYK